ncbi:hypothetical protein [Burkholderia plantarii]|uniref:hypothetical protein n=2 Tax=Burkholderia plantarii TaxID=41899 RepID=UPI000706D11E|nr:hypothetical protein [Burkholderia plantarii]ALK31938.1 hypothetical protein bpln_1g31750 [Burkholderia plantarii]
MVSASRRKKWCVSLVFVAIYKLALADNPGSLVYDYKNCTWQDDGYQVRVSLVMDFKRGLDGPRVYTRSRGVVVWAYDKNNSPYSFSSSDAMVGLNGWASARDTHGISYDGLLAQAFIGDNHDWININPVAANILIIFPSRGKWRSVAVLAAEREFDSRGSFYDFQGEIKGAAYIYPDSDGGDCQVVSPVNPPRPPLTIRMSAPDWDLGELPVDHGEKRFTAAADQLCFTYSGLSGDGADVVVDADSENGTVANQYQLKALADPTQIVPYSVMLNDGTTEFTLPNQNKSEIKLNASGRTCLAPTFGTYVRPGLKKGAYTDVLTFTVTTKT